MDHRSVSHHLDEIEGNLNELRLAVQALIHAQLRRRSDEGAGQLTLGSWIAGELRVMAGTGDTEQDVAGYAMSSDPHDSVYWCYSRYVCPTVSCGSDTGFWC